MRRAVSENVTEYWLDELAVKTAQLYRLHDT